MDALKNKTIILSNDEETFHAAAKDLLVRAQEAVAQKGRFNLVLSGGNTPKKFYTLLASTEPYRNTMPWSDIYFYFGDERYLPQDDENNNYRMATQYLFSKLPIPVDHIFPMPTTEFSDPKDAASAYAQTINGIEFDLIYLGLGDNSHTASLMPDTDLVKAYAENKIPNEYSGAVAALWVSELNMYRITLTPPTINNSYCIEFLVVGENKSQAVWNIIHGRENPVKCPAQLIHCKHGPNMWFMDRQAASQLEAQE